MFEYLEEGTWDILKKWVSKKCPHEKNWKNINSCLKENTLDFKDIVLFQSYPAEHHIQINKNLGIVHFLSLSNHSIHQVKDIDEDLHYTISLNKTLKYSLELKDPTFLFMSPNPLSFPTTRINLYKSSSHQLRYLQVCFMYSFSMIQKKILISR